MEINMKKLLTLLAAVLLTAVSAQAQWVWESFEGGVGNDTTYFPNRLNNGFFTNGPGSLFNLSASDDALDGEEALKIDYRVEAFDGWGGYVVRLHKNDLENLGDSAKYDLSSGKYLSFWVKVVTPAVKDQPGDVNFEFKVKEQKDTDTGEDLFLKNFGTIAQEPAGTWRQYIVPLEHNSVNPDGFSTQFGNGDGEFQPWDIVGYEFAIVYITDGKNENPPAATGTFLMDKIQILGQAFEPLMTFDQTASVSAYYDKFVMDWDGVAAPLLKLDFSDENADTVEGTGALKVDYKVIGSQNWGGYASFRHMLETPVDLSTKSAVGFYLKNLVPPGLEGRVITRFEIYDGDNEEWVAIPNFDISKAGDWQFLYFPLEESSKPWGDMRPGDPGFNNKSNGNKTFDINAVKGFQFEIIITNDGTQPFGADVVAEGSFLLDLITPSGFAENDTEAPAAPTGLLALPGEYKNLLIWDDVPGEEKEKYSIYYSGYPITDLTDPLVFTLTPNKAEGLQAAEHFINSPINNATHDIYYAINATDKAGNVGAVAATESAVQNTGKGVPVVWLGAPESFVADGNLSEWASVPAWEVKSSDNTGTIINPGTWPHDGDTDLWFKAWAAVSSTHLYMAMQVYDDYYFVDTTKASYEQDAPDVVFGLYDYKGKDHTGYRRGATPDYHFRMNAHRVSDDINGATVARQAHDNYEWIQTETGYIFEWSISFEAIAALHEGDALFTPEDGMMIAFDWLVNDGDANLARQGGMRWSQSNEDNAWNNVSSWNYTWIGNNSSVFFTSVDGKGETARSFNLSQNYPNPFNPTTAIRFSMKQAGNVSLKVYDVLGKEVSTLFNGQKPQGEYTVHFNGASLPSGIYFVRMMADGYTAVRKMTLIK